MSKMDEQAVALLREQASHGDSKAAEVLALLDGPVTITIEGRTFEVSKDGDQYVLTGTRGAKYRTLRNRPNPHMLYLFNAKDWTKSAPQVWLTDKNGTLEVAR
jgi:hypothetical protein